MSDFGYDKLKQTENLNVTFHDTNTKEGRELWWDDSLARKIKQVYIDHNIAGVIEVLQMTIFFDNFHTLATKEMKQAYIKSDHFKEIMDKYRATFVAISNRDK